MSSMFKSLGLALALALALAQCRFTATEVEVVVDTDVAPNRSMRIVATVTSAIDARLMQTVTLIRGANPGEISLPNSFAVIPSALGSRAQRAVLTLDVTVSGAAAGAPELRFRRESRFEFVPQTRGRLRLFLSTACAAPADGCANVPANQCTVAARCDEAGLTCGDDGQCVTPEVAIAPSQDVNQRDISAVDLGVPTDVQSGTADARSDVLMDAPNRDVPNRDAPNVDVPSAPMDAGVGRLGASCVTGMDCVSGVCVTDPRGRGVCSQACASTPDCSLGWTCVTNRCRPAADCTGAFQWNNPFGDQSLRLVGMQRAGLNAGPNSFSFACVRDAARVSFCGTMGALTLTGPNATVLGGGGISPTPAGPLTFTLNVNGPGPTFVTVDNTAGAVALSINAANTIVVIVGPGNNAINVQNSRVGHAYFDTAGPWVNEGTFVGTATVVRANSSTNNGTIMGGLRFGGVAPAAPACP